MKFGAKFDSVIHKPWIEFYISYKRLKRVLGKIEMQQNKAKRAAEKDRERQQREAAQGNSSPPLAPANSTSNAGSVVGSFGASKYSSPLLRSQSSTTAERPSTPPPNLPALQRADSSGYSVLSGEDMQQYSTPTLYGTNTFASYNTFNSNTLINVGPTGGAAGATPGPQSDARPEFFAVIEDDIRRINKFYREKVTAWQQEVQGFQDEHRPAIGSSPTHLKPRASQMFNTLTPPLESFALPPATASKKASASSSLSSSSSACSMAKVRREPQFVDPLTDPTSPDGDDDDGEEEFRTAPPPSSYKVPGSQGAFPPSGGLPKLNLDVGASLLDDTLSDKQKGVSGAASKAEGASSGTAAASVVTSLLDHRPLSQNLYKAYGSTGGDLDALTDEQRQEVVHSQAARLAREKKLISLYQEMQRLKFLVEINYIGFGKILKKYEKVTGERVRRSFMLRLDQEDFFKSGDLGALIQLTETLFYVISDGRRLSEVAAVMSGPEKAAKTEYIWKPRVLLLTLAVFFALFFIPMLGEENIRAHRCIVLMGVVILMWVTEAVPYFVTALFIPILTVTLGILADSSGVPLSAEDASKQVFSKVFDHSVALVLGGFSISAAFSKFQFELHLAAAIQHRFADRPYLFILAFMLLGFVLSMFINNVAAPVLCLAVLMPIIRDLPRESPFARCALLALAFACNIGGMLTPISSPQNTVSLSELSKQAPNNTISFIGWIEVAVPFGLLLLFLCWGFLILALRPNDVAHVPEILHDQGDTPFSLNHYMVLAVSGVTILLWCTFSVTQPFFGDLGIIALLPLVVFFGTGILSKNDFNNFSWNLIYLLGGGNVLGLAVSSSGLLNLVVNQVAPSLVDQTEWVVVLAFCAFVSIVTTFVSHTVAAIIIMPVVVKIGIAVGHPEAVLFTSALMCSGAMALPMTSFPNINSLLADDDYGQPYLQVADFLKFGGIFSAITCALLVTVGYGLIHLQFD